MLGILDYTTVREHFDWPSLKDLGGGTYKYVVLANNNKKPMPPRFIPLLSLFFLLQQRYVVATPLSAFATRTTSSARIRHSMVNLHGHGSLKLFAGRRSAASSSQRLLVPRHNQVHDVAERPPDPQSLLSEAQLQDCMEQLHEWFQGVTSSNTSAGKSSILALTGAGLSTESGIPDYRGSQGSYHEGHKPMIHDAFISNHSSRQRYWGRGMVGWREFDKRRPNAGHEALVQLEKMKKIGVAFEDSPIFHDNNNDNESRYLFGNGLNEMSIITQNVDNLHQRAGSKLVTELHGRTSRLKCMNCGAYASRNSFTSELESLNADWLQDALAIKEEESTRNEMRPDGDAQLAHHQSYGDIQIPSCHVCGDDGFYKPDVVFFGDSVPKHRVERCKAAVQASGGLLCIGTSLAVHSAYRFVKLAAVEGIPVCILNVGETRPEAEGLVHASGDGGITKIEAPIGSTLAALVERFEQEQPVNLM